MIIAPSIEIEPGPGPGQVAAGLILGSIGFIFGSIALAAVVVGMVSVPAAQAADVARVQAFGPWALAIGVAHVVVAFLVGLSRPARIVAAAATAFGAVAAAAGAVAVGRGWDLFGRSVVDARNAAPDGIGILAVTALVYAVAFVLIVRSVRSGQA